MISVILEIISGPATGKTFELKPGQLAHVGRSAWSEICLSADPLLSDRHFALECTESTCRLRDLYNPEKTKLNGIVVEEATLQNGDRISAGQTIMLVHLRGESSVAVLAGAPEKPAMRTDIADQKLTQFVLRLLKGQAKPLYAVIDAARSPEVLEYVRRVQEPYQSLYEGPQAEELADIAPYLIQFRSHSPALDALVELGWGESWGVYLTCSSTFQEIRHHLRCFLKVRLPDQRVGLFRFYDPRVLRVFLPVLNREEMDEFFGPIASFSMEAEEPEVLLRFTATALGVKEEAFSLFAMGDSAVHASEL